MKTRSIDCCSYKPAGSTFTIKRIMDSLDWDDIQFWETGTGVVMITNKTAILFTDVPSIIPNPAIVYVHRRVGCILEIAEIPVFANDVGTGRSESEMGIRASDGK